MEESIIYSYGFVTISSAVAACCKETDVVFIDEFTSVPIWQGLKAARSRIIKFSHNNPWDFHQKALTVTNCRKFLILEGISWTTGQLCPLPAFLEIAERFKIRVFLEESYTLGVFGESGRGLTEYYRIEPSRIDMIMGTFERAMGSIGGFCAGSFTIISQQQVAGSGYIFSASLPTYLVGVVLKGLEVMGEKPVKFARLAVMFHRFLEECGFNVTSHPEAPFKLVKLGTLSKAMTVHDFCRKKGVHFIRNHNELVINLNVALMDQGEKLKRVFGAMKGAADLVN
ncbi:Serine palmitoyltransferase 1-like Protein [Tribolium castaneum]|uniref:Serine palmitoyltransferase 1 n=2 Tax=Tribolium castaneum TaxID=7070 RepID=D2A640_TRICA|nr:Serine palmitoyltransferase 1-like Protein [Tribolium castaneum]